MAEDLEPDDALYWHKYIMWPDEDGKPETYKGVYTAWNENRLKNSIEMIPAFVDMTLYADVSTVISLQETAGDSGLILEKLNSVITDMDEDDLDNSAYGTVNLIWQNSRHHWGRLMNEPIDDKEFVEEYLFRFIDKLASYKNSVDGHDKISDSQGVSWTTARIMDMYNYPHEDVEKTFDEFVVEEGFEPKFYKIAHDRGDVSVVTDSAETSIVGSLQDMQNNIGMYDSWDMFLGKMADIGYATVYGNFPRITTYVGSSESVRRSMAEYVVSLIGDQLGEMARKYANEYGAP